MSCIVLSLEMIAVLALVLAYVMTTQSRALDLRDDMVEDVAKALENPDLSTEGRKAVLSLFHASLKPGAVPRYAVRLAWYRLRDRLDDLDHGLADGDYAILSKLIRRHVLRINLVAGPHWYVLLAIVVTIWAGFAAITGYAFRWTDTQRHRLEHAFINAFGDFAH